MYDDDGKPLSSDEMDSMASELRSMGGSTLLSARKDAKLILGKGVSSVNPRVAIDGLFSWAKGAPTGRSQRAGDLCVIVDLGNDYEIDQVSLKHAHNNGVGPEMSGGCSHRGQTLSTATAADVGDMEVLKWDKDNPTGWKTVDMMKAMQDAAAPICKLQPLKHLRSNVYVTVGCTADSSPNCLFTPDKLEWTGWWL